MNHKLTRRRFGQLALTSTAVAGLSYFANQTFAQTPHPTLIGVHSLPQTPTSRRLTLQSSNPITGRVQPLAAPEFLPNGTPLLNHREQLSGLTSFKDGTLVLAITSMGLYPQEATVTRLTILSQSPKSFELSGLHPQEALQSLLVSDDGQLLGLVARKGSRPPARIVKIHPKTGKLSDSNLLQLPKHQRFITLSQGPDGTLYTLSVSSLGATSLVQLDWRQKRPVVLAPLKFNNQVWTHGMSSLVCSASGQFFALGNAKNESPKHVYAINPHSGSMTKLMPFDVAKITHRTFTA
jgi:hypothetical protein